MLLKGCLESKMKEKCLYCQGKGLILNYESYDYIICPACGGSGYKKQNERN